MWLLYAIVKFPNVLGVKLIGDYIMREILLVQVMMFSFTAYASVPDIGFGFEEYQVDKSKVTIDNPAKQGIHFERLFSVTDGSVLNSNTVTLTDIQPEYNQPITDIYSLPLEVGWI